MTSVACGFSFVIGHFLQSHPVVAGREEAARESEHQHPARRFALHGRAMRIGACPTCNDRNHLSALIAFSTREPSSAWGPATTSQRKPFKPQHPKTVLNWACGLPCEPSLRARTCVEGFHCLTKLRINLVCDGRYSNQQRFKINSGPIGVQGTEY
jgi:hypothetical protein